MTPSSAVAPHHDQEPVRQQHPGGITGEANHPSQEEVGPVARESWDAGAREDRPAPTDALIDLSSTSSDSDSDSSMVTVVSSNAARMSNRWETAVPDQLPRRPSMSHGETAARVGMSCCCATMGIVSLISGGVMIDGLIKAQSLLPGSDHYDVSNSIGLSLFFVLGAIFVGAGIYYFTDYLRDLSRRPYV
jgi:hypothetical protein